VRSDARLWLRAMSRHTQGLRCRRVLCLEMSLQRCIVCEGPGTESAGIGEVRVSVRGDAMSAQVVCVGESSAADGAVVWEDAVVCCSLMPLQRRPQRVRGRALRTRVPAPTPHTPTCNPRSRQRSSSSLHTHLKHQPHHLAPHHTFSTSNFEMPAHSQKFLKQTNVWDSIRHKVLFGQFQHYTSGQTMPAIHFPRV
jgi:hypothetical protein